MSDDEVKAKPLGPFDLIKGISQTKSYYGSHEEFEAAYVPFLINRGLSLFRDTLMLVNDMNMSHHLSKKQQYDYLFYSIPRGNRFQKWPKKIAEDENLELVKQYFGYSDGKAKQALTLLDEQTIKRIKEKFIQGGPEK